MAESAAEAKYREFESLRSRFGGGQGSCKQQQQISRREAGCKRRSKDPRANAPPLVPLVEEAGDQLEEVCNYGCSARSSVVSCMLEGEGLSCTVKECRIFLQDCMVEWFFISFCADCEPQSSDQGAMEA